MLEFFRTIINALKMYVDEKMSGLNQYIDEKMVLPNPDWNQNDTSAQDYIKNRTHWDSRYTEIIDHGFNFTFDGNLEGKESVDINGDASIYMVKLSDTPLTTEQLVGSTVAMQNTDENISAVVPENIVVDNGTYIDVGNSTVLSVFEESNINDVSFGVGLWVPCNQSMHVSSISKTNIEKIEHGELKQLDSKYIKDMYYTFDGENVLMPETQLTFVDNGIYLPVTIDLKMGKTYAVTYNGTVYKCVAWYNGSREIVFIGNGIYADSPEGNKEPFLTDGSYMMSNDASATVKISEVVEKINYVNPKYIKDMYYEEEDIILVNNLTNTDYNNGNAPACNFVIGKTYKVIWNGEVYDNLVCHLEDEYNVIASGENGCPFYIDDDGGNALYISSDNEDESWTVSIIEKSGSIHKIDEKYLPERQTEMVLVDKATGLDYIVSMINGKIVYESLISYGIYVDTYPLQTIYGKNEELNTDGMIVAAECQDGSAKEIQFYTCSNIDEDGIVVITYVERGKTYTCNVYVETIEYLEDFYYVSNGDGTVTITGWKGTCHGEPSTEMIFPDDSRVIL